MKRAFYLTLLSFFLLGHQSHSFADAALTFKQAWIAEAPPVSRVLAAYMEIHNNTQHEIIIDSIASKDFSRIEFHQSYHENNLAKMRHYSSLTIPAGDSLILQQGGYHLMLFNPSRKLRSGDSTMFTVTTADKQSHVIKVTVKKSTTQSIHHH